MVDYTHVEIRSALANKAVVTEVIPLFAHTFSQADLATELTGLPDDIGALAGKNARRLGDVDLFDRSLGVVHDFIQRWVDAQQGKKG